MNKSELRKYYNNLLKNQTHISLPDIEIDNYQLILAYIPLKYEVDTIPLLEKALLKEIKTAVPTSDYRFFAVLPKNWTEKLEKLNNGTKSIKDTELLDISKINCNTLVLVPGLAFTEDGKRLGRGCGFYDRVISVLESRALESEYIIDIKGVCTKTQLADSLPFEFHDKKVGELIIC